jgi:hypothetical protein
VADIGLKARPGPKNKHEKTNKNLFVIARKFWYDCKDEKIYLIIWLTVQEHT